MPSLVEIGRVVRSGKEVENVKSLRQRRPLAHVSLKCLKINKQIENN